ncbi:uricase [Rhizopogon vinicolor AM-OR11-026]|uniref:Uricase n=1 Tax=Rhizopogon vinicolor AM-OR11-026 TaxID=1314800 RepID=A0A1B7NAP4_9AGAM|nr:uricase [Rhizopogon vinicolor AM-OR11-026]
MSESVLTHARYGKDFIRVFRVVRGSEFHHIVEYNVSVMLEGDIESSYTVADNSVVVATDSMKNITYYLAKTSPHILSPERFALHLGTYIVSKYAHIHRAIITIEKLRWSRIALGANDQPHPHSFIRDGDDKHTVEVEVDASAGKDNLSAKVTSGIADLLVLKTAGSAFYGYIRDEHTTLMEVDDRILSTSVDLAYTFAPLSLSPPSDAKKLDFTIPEGFAPGSVWDADNVVARARNATLDIFALDDSASVQATLFKMGQRVIAENAGVVSVTYKLPNKHYIPVNMNYIGIDNTTPANAEVFVPTSAPSGLISATISRK